MLKTQVETEKDEHEKTEQTNETGKHRKGTLTIREVGLRRGETQPQNKDDDIYSRPAISTTGKLRCDFCKREFNTLTEQRQHMTRRHATQLNE